MHRNLGGCGNGGVQHPFEEEGTIFDVGDVAILSEDGVLKVAINTGREGKEHCARVLDGTGISTGKAVGIDGRFGDGVESERRLTEVPLTR